MGGEIMNVYEKLMTVQTKLRAPKGQYNSYGGYSYRSCEDILEALKPLLAEVGAIVNISDEVKLIGDRFYVEATAMFLDCETGDSVVARASAREAQTRKGMDDSQITGAVSSYARKYALNGLFAIDDNKDADSTNTHNKENKPNTTTRSKEIKPNMTPTGITEAQLKRVFAIGNKAGIKKEVVEGTVRKIFNCEAKDMTKEQYDNICERLEKKAGGK